MCLEIKHYLWLLVLRVRNVLLVIPVLRLQSSAHKPQLLQTGSSKEIHNKKILCIHLLSFWVLDLLRGKNIPVLIDDVSLHLFISIAVNNGKWNNGISALSRDANV